MTHFGVCWLDSWAPWLCWPWPELSPSPSSSPLTVNLSLSENVSQVCVALSHALYDPGPISLREGRWPGLSQSRDSFYLVKNIDQSGASCVTDRWPVWPVLKVITMEIKVLEPLAGSSQLQTWTWPANPRSNRELRMTNPPLLTKRWDHRYSFLGTVKTSNESD